VPARTCIATARAATILAASGFRHGSTCDGMISPRFDDRGIPTGAKKKTATSSTRNYRDEPRAGHIVNAASALSVGRAACGERFPPAGHRPPTPSSSCKGPLLRCGKLVRPSALDPTRSTHSSFETFGGAVKALLVLIPIIDPDTGEMFNFASTTLPRPRSPPIHRQVISHAPASGDAAPGVS